MNTKGIKFLAVLAVMVMAFAAVIVLAPADNDVVAVKVFNNPDVVVDPAVIDKNNTESKYYFSDDATVKIKDLSGISSSTVEFYVQNGKELELNFKEADNGEVDGKTIVIYSVTADQQRHTTSTVKVGGEDGQKDGKILLNNTKIAFTSADKQSFVYKAAMPKTVETVTTSGVMQFKTTVDIKKNYAVISATDILPVTEIGANVTVASGQSIQTTSDVSGFKYGVKVVETSTATTPVTTYTYYATGANAGTATLTTTGDKVEIFDGTAAASVGTTAVVKATSVTSTTGVTISYGAENQTTVAGMMESGTMTISGNVFFDDFTTYATVTLTSSAFIQSGSVMTVEGTVYLKNDAEKIENLTLKGESGVVVAQNEKLWTYPTVIPVLNLDDDDFKGQYDVYAITKVAEVKDAFSTAKIEKNQTFTVVADTVVTTSLDVEGIIIIEPGVTLTVTKTQKTGASVKLTGNYAQIINYGTIQIATTVDYEAPQATPYGLHILGGTVTNEGSIIGASDSNVPKVADKYSVNVKFAGDAKGNGLINKGTISTSKNDTVYLDGHFINTFAGTVSIGGIFTGSDVVNKGVFTLNNAKISDSLSVTMSEGSSFIVVAAEIASTESLTIQNNASNNVISFTAPTLASNEKCSIRNITINDTSSWLSSTYQLDLSGSASTSVPKDKFVTIATKGNINVTDAATINSGFELNLTEATKMKVSGDFTITKDVDLKETTNADNLTMTVTGKATVAGNDILNGCTFLGAKVTTENATVYTTVENAVDVAVEAEVTIVEAGYIPASGTTAAKYPTITKDVVIPAGMTIVETEEMSLIIDKSATVAVEANAMLSFNKIIVEDGMLIAADANNVNIDTVIADVKKQDDASTAVACMNLEIALEFATAGDVIELSNDFYGKNETLTIPAGVTVDATASEDGTQFVLVNSNLVVNGALVVDNFAFIATTDDNKSITVNGFIYDSCPNGTCFNGWWYVPFGVSYYVTDDEDQTWYVLTSIENLQPAINVADDAKVSVEGDAVLGTITIEGRDDMPAEVTFKGDVTADEIKISDTTLKFLNKNEVTATVSDALGSITLYGAYVDGALSIYSMDDAGVYMNGAVTDSSIGTYGIMFEGITGIDGTTSKAAINWGKYNDGHGEMVATPTVLFAGVTTVEGKKAYINDDEEIPNGMVTVTGVLYVDHTSKLTVNSDMQVTGSFIVADREGDEVAGAADVNGDIFVGALKSEIYSYADADSFYDPANGKGYGEKLGVAAAASISGKIELGRPADSKPFFITVVAGSNIDPAIIEDLTSVNIMIELETWITIYGYGESLYSLDGLKAPVINAAAVSVLDGNDREAGVFHPFLKVIVDSDEQPLKLYNGFVNITLDYEVFAVKIKTDGSVKAVYIDGILMETGNVANIFMIYKQTTGTHKVTVEPATGYTADGCVLYTEMGTILPGMAFTFTEYDCEFVEDIDYTGYLVTYDIKGTQVEPEPVPPTPEEESQWTITTILLVILVVLIAIMAVIVALRLNRS